jgi:hypothetical protein
MTRRRRDQGRRKEGEDKAFHRREKEFANRQFRKKIKRRPLLKR